MTRPADATPRRSRAGSACRSSSRPTDGRLPIDVEDALYRIAQEALHNVVKHAAASRSASASSAVDDAIRLAVDDDGSGFDATAIPPGHLGIAGMRARAEKIGGRLTVDSRPGRGTTIEAIVPAAERPVAEAVAEGRPEDPSPNAGASTNAGYPSRQLSFVASPHRHRSAVPGPAGAADSGHERRRRRPGHPRRRSGSSSWTPTIASATA